MTTKITFDNFEPSKLTPADQVPWPHPDWADLNDWAFENATEVFETTRYLSISRYDLFLSLWHHAGRPVEGFESALWTKEDALG
tara:strand:- start:10728 stop:10979 length:252 start_codon:yes stop_codon:yes gene_type:complete